jgi:hypothetical protein
MEIIMQEPMQIPQQLNAGSGAGALFTSDPQDYPLPPGPANFANLSSSSSADGSEPFAAMASAASNISEPEPVAEAAATNSQSTAGDPHDRIGNARVFARLPANSSASTLSGSSTAAPAPTSSSSLSRFFATASAAPFQQASSASSATVGEEIGISLFSAHQNSYNRLHNRQRP